MNVRVVKHSADEEKDVFIVVLKGTSDLIPYSLIDVEIKLTGKVENLLDQFPRNCMLKFSLEAETEK